MTALRRARVGYPAAVLLVGLTVGLLKVLPSLADSTAAPRPVRGADPQRSA